MKFSIIVPVYNAGAYLPECVDSVLAQPFRDWELILVDDGSTDESGTIADNYAREDRRIRVIHQDNSGQLFARRVGLAAARGEYVLFLDSDDYWDIRCLETVAAAIDETAADVVMFSWRKFGDGQPREQADGKAPEQPGWLEKSHIYRVLISGAEYNSLCFKAWKRSLFEGDTTDYRHFAGTCWGEDKAQLLYPVTRAKHVWYLPQRLYHYRHNPAGAIQNIDLTKAPVMLSGKVFELLYAYMKQWGMDDPESRAMVAEYYLRNFLSVYYLLRKSCADREARGRFRRYDWKTVVCRDAFRYAYTSRLSLRERLKLINARYFRF